jgi:hypothetical protein
MTQIMGFLTRKPNIGKLFSPDQVATGIGEGVTGKSVRRTLQKQGLAGTEGKQAVIQSGEHFLYLSKEGNRNRYRAVPKGQK